uniref:Uncharacterized protein n=1 Tax=Pararge aegeria TaxID=116150 RepID=S4PFA0_9NEOP
MRYSRAGRSLRSHINVSFLTFRFFIPSYYFQTNKILTYLTNSSGKFTFRTLDAVMLNIQTPTAKHIINDYKNK